MTAPLASVNLQIPRLAAGICESSWLIERLVIAHRHGSSSATLGQEDNALSKPPSGHVIHAVLRGEGQMAARERAEQFGQPDLFERVAGVALQKPVPSFLHSALCAMSLPVRKPADDTTSIIRQDGQYTLAITPRPVLRRIDGQQSMKVLGVPYGSLPRLILIHLMTEAVRNSSPHIVLGKSFTDWLRRLGLKTMSYGPRGSATLVREQLDRLLACEWVIRWDNQNAAGEQEFAVKEVKLTTDYAGVDGRQGSFSRELVLTQAFYEHLRAHAVPLDENAICQLRDSATAIDLYTWLAYRLPRVSTGRPTSLSWSQLASHFGNDGNNIRKFRQTIRDAWDRHVSAVYPEAKVEFDTSAVRLYSSPAPLQRRPLRLAASNPSRAEPAPVAATPSCLEFMTVLKSAIGPVNTRSWLSDVVIDSTGDTIALHFPTAFKVDYVRQNFASQLRRAADSAGLTDIPDLMHRSCPAAKSKS